MAISIALIVILGLVSEYFFRKMKLPGLLGMLFTGILFGPYVLNLLQPELLKVSADLRMLALIVILLRVGLELKRDTLNRVGKIAVIMGSVPALFEGTAIALAAPILLGISRLEAALLGAVIAAVSPAVIVPAMLGYIARKRGTGKGIPTLILSSSAIDNVFVIMVFTIILGLESGTHAGIGQTILEIPESLFFGLAAGGVAGFALFKVFENYSLRATKMTITIIAVSLLMVWVEQYIKSYFSMSALLAIMTIGFIILEKSEIRAHKISAKLSKFWIFAEILLFVLVGAQVDIKAALDAGLAGAGLIIIGLAARSVGTYLSLIGSDLTGREKLFCIVSYIPKATVQAAIGAVAMETGVPGGDVILAVAVLSILITAPLGAIGIAFAGPKWLEKENDNSKLPMSRFQRT